MENTRLCKQCLLRESAQKASYQNLFTYLKHLDPDLKADEAEYENRLSLCKKCKNLLQGMCRVCGCFVELRAAIKTNSCPCTEKKW